MGNLPLGPARFYNLQIAVILCAGVVAAAAAYTLHFLALLLLVVVGTLAYCFFRYLFYDLEASSTRESVSKFLSNLTLPFVTSYNAPPFPGDRSKRALLTSKGRVPIIVHRESQKLMQMVCRDFVLSWYKKISRDPHFPQDVVGLLDHVALQISVRIQHIDVHDLVLNILAVVEPYLSAVNDVGQIPNRGKVVFNVQHPDALLVFEQKANLCHPALSTEKSELDYLRKLMDTFICASIPAQYKNCDVACRLVREVLVYKLFKPLVDLLCSPDFLMQAIPKVLTKATNEKIQRDYSDMEKENKVLEEELAQPEGLLSSLLSSEFVIESGMTEIVPWPEQEAELLKRRAKSFPLPLRRPTSHAMKPDGPLLELEEGFEQSAEMVLVDFPPIYITRHVTVEIERKQHIGYIIKFPRKLLSEAYVGDLGLGPAGEAEALKRYSEFFTFHRQLLRSEHARQAKTLSLPDKQLFSSFLSKLPFSSDDSNPTVIHIRKEGLDNYVQNLYQVKEIRESKIFQEFLASGVKWLECAKIIRNSKELPKPPVAAKPRRWSSLIDWMKTSVAEEQPKPRRDIRKPLNAFLENNLPPPYHAVLMSSDHTHLNNQVSSPLEPQSLETPVTTNSNIVPPTQSLPTKLHDSCISLNSTGSLPLELAKITRPLCRTENLAAGQTCSKQLGMNTIIAADTTSSRTTSHTQKPSFSHKSTHSLFLNWLQDLYGFIRTAAIRVHMFLYLAVDSFFKKPVTPETLMALAKEQEKRSPLANCLLSLANEATRSTSPELWITNEATQLALLGIFGKALDSYLWKELDMVVNDEKRWARALYNLRHTLWPGGKPYVSKSIQRTQKERERLKEDAAAAIKQFLPSALPYIIGSREYDNAVNHCLSCLFNPRINRHFLYKLIDIFMPRLVPELNDQSFQRELMLLRTQPFYLKRDF